jgi:hypothetical protein
MNATAAQLRTGLATAPVAVVELGWAGLLRLALVQTALGAVVVLATSTLNRIMIIELKLPAALPAALIALYYMVQLLRPRVGFGADRVGVAHRGSSAAWRCWLRAASWPRWLPR